MRVLPSLLAVWFVVAGCEKPRPSERVPGPPPISERRELVAAGPNKLDLGGNCDLVGSPGCSSGLCFKTGPTKSEGYRCSKTCQRDTDCGAGFVCSQMYPAEGGWFCVERVLLRDGGPWVPHAPRPDGGGAFDAGEGQ